MIPLTARAHAQVLSIIEAGEIAIDATVGNGHDTLFLADCVTQTGFVYGFDIQPQAIAVTMERLRCNELKHVTLLQQSHANLRASLPAEIEGKVAVVMMNLGYLPGGDKQLTTRSDSTLAAIRDGIGLLRPGGIMTIIGYPGHSEGAIETAAVVDFLSGVSPVEFQVDEPFPEANRIAAPRLFVIRRA